MNRLEYSRPCVCRAPSHRLVLCPVSDLETRCMILRMCYIRIFKCCVCTLWCVWLEWLVKLNYLSREARLSLPGNVEGAKRVNPSKQKQSRREVDPSAVAITFHFPCSSSSTLEHTRHLLAHAQSRTSYLKRKIV